MLVNERKIYCSHTTEEIKVSQMADSDIFHQDLGTSISYEASLKFYPSKISGLSQICSVVISQNAFIINFFIAVNQHLLFFFL